MGLVRYILAITVLINHTGALYGLTFVDAYLAIKVFFIISGFYMALILSEKYVGPGRYRIFITNRLLRLFPTYWLTLALSVFMSLAFWILVRKGMLLAPWITRESTLNPVSLLAFIGVNLSIFGQDALFFSFVDPATGGLVFARDALYQALPAWFFLVIPQAWTLSLEMTFYLLAPFLVTRRSAVLLALVAACAALRLYLAARGFPLDPWKQRFFPAESGFFLLGILSYRIHARLRIRELPRRLGLGLWVGYLLLLIMYQFLPGVLVKEFFLYVLTVLGLPFLFLFTKRLAWDRDIGELSYPIYISHWSMILLIRYFIGLKHLPLVTLIVTTLFCLAVNRYFVEPIEHYRQRRVHLAATAAARRP